MINDSDYTITSKNIELDKLISLRLHALRTAPESFGERYVSAANRTPAMWRTWFDERASGTSKIFVVDYDGEYKGMCGVQMSATERSTAYLWGMYLVPQFRGKGLAGSLLKEVTNYLKAQQVETLTIDVEINNSVALRIYKKLGFTTIGEKDGLISMGYLVAQ